jgi:putative ABC transport system permease protein
MNLWRYLALARLAVRSLRGHPLRTLLTALGVLFGVGSVIAMVAVGVGAEREILAEFGRLGMRNIILNSVKPPEQRQSTATRSWVLRYGLTYADERRIRETLPGLDRVLPVHQRRQKAWYGSRGAEVTAYAVPPDYLGMFDLAVRRGRALTAADDERLARVCVVRPGLLRELGIYEEPLGLSLKLEEEYYEIVGVLDDRDFLGYAQKALAIDKATREVYIPYGTSRERLGTRTFTRRSGQFEATDVDLSQIVVSVEELDDVLTTARMLDRLLAIDHRDKDYEMTVPLEAMQQRKRAQEIFNLQLIIIASISLLVGSIGIANIMLATVTERTREIGIRRALGAKRRHVLAQFLMETVTISILGGLLGVGAGVGFVQVINRFSSIHGIVTAGSILLALPISVGVGVVSGIFPARRAAYLDPITALRHE